MNSDTSRVLRSPAVTGRVGGDTVSDVGQTPLEGRHGRWDRPPSLRALTAKIGAVAAGKTPVRIDLGYDQPGGAGGYRGYVDDISITG